jgi:hypothetical protein
MAEYFLLLLIAALLLLLGLVQLIGLAVLYHAVRAVSVIQITYGRRIGDRVTVPVREVFTREAPPAPPL